MHLDYKHALLYFIAPKQSRKHFSYGHRHSLCLAASTGDSGTTSRALAAGGHKTAGNDSLRTALDASGE